MPKILLTNYYAPAPLAVVQSLVPDGFTLLPLDRPGKAAVIERIPEADYLLVGGRTQIDREVLDPAARLKMIQRTGVGLDSLDLPLLQARGIPVFVNAGVNARSVAEHTIMLILATLRRLPEADSSVKRGQWKKHELGIRCHDLHGKTVGLVGLGSIGRLVAEMLQPFQVRLLYNKRAPIDAADEASLGLRFVDLPALLRGSDVVSLHCPLNAETRGMIGETELALMKPGAMLINTSRGPLIDQDALRAAIAAERLGGAGLDVFASEPIADGDGITSLPHVVLTPHIGGLAFETFRDMLQAAFANIRRFAMGRINELGVSGASNLSA
jgi:D-3-phosphoglycerate dehydrogenase